MKTNFPNIKGYEIISLLGQGGMGSVFLAKEKSSSRQVAIKVISGSIADSTANEAVVRFKREIKVCASFAHPYVTKIYDGGVQSDGSLYLVMEYIQGKSLLEKVDEQLLKESEARSLALKMCEALSYVHAQDIFHRDIKPANIIHLSEERSILVDFGLAFPTDMTRLTETGNAVGTLQTMAPEQLQGKDVTAASDIYSLGATLYYCVTGHYPFNQENIIAMAAGVQQKTIPWAADFQKGLSRKFCRILQKCLAPKVQKRFQSARELEKALVEKPTDEVVSSVSAKAANTKERSKSDLLTIVLLVLLLSLPLGWKSYRAHQNSERAKRLVQVRQEIINSGEVPSKQLCHRYGSLLLATAEVDPRPVVEEAAIGLSELLFDAIKESRQQRAAQLTLLFLERHGMSWYESGRQLPAEEIAQAAFDCKMSLPLVKSIRQQMAKSKNVETKKAMITLLHRVCVDLSRTVMMSQHWQEIKIESKKVAAILEPLFKSAKDAKERQSMAFALFCVYRIDLSEEARDKSLALLSELCTKEGQVIDLPSVVYKGVIATTKSSPEKSDVVPTRFRRAVIPFIEQARAMVTDREQSLDFLFMLVQQYNATGAQLEALKELDKVIFKPDDDPKYKITYYNKRASILLMLRRYKEAQKACELAISHAKDKDARRHLKDRLLNIKSLAIVENYE